MNVIIGGNDSTNNKKYFNDIVDNINGCLLKNSYFWYKKDDGKTFAINVIF